MTLYAGFDCSTQSMTAVVIDAGRREVVCRTALRFDEALPEFGTRSGVLPSGDPRIVRAPPGMWALALERTLAAVAAHVDRGSIRALSGSAQQHGSVYCNSESGRAFASGWAAGALARDTAPVWMDTSTEGECREIETAAGGAAALAALTGSRAFPRFTGPQIRKFALEAPDAYARTTRVHLVSSFLASLLLGAHAPLDHADASGMNLLDLRAREWSDVLLDATAPGLRPRLPALAPSTHVAGTLSTHWRARFGLPPARVVVWSGDNPCSLIGTGLVTEGQLGISLGTSDTIFGPMDDARVSRDGTGHVFVSPTGAYMGITVFRNGSLARERVRDRFGLDWDGFSSALRSTPAGNHGAIMLPWFEPEITPIVAVPAPVTFGLDPDDAAAGVRGVVEAQMMALARHSTWMSVRPRRIHVTGGAAANPDVLQVMADVFDAEVQQFDSTDSAALGAAIRAFHADRAADGDPIAWLDAVAGFAVPRTASTVTPIPGHVDVYRRARLEYQQREADALGRLAAHRVVPSAGDQDSGRRRGGPPGAKW